MKHNNDEDFNVNGNWFHRTKVNIGALEFPSSTEELFAVTKVVHLHFFKSLIQANIRKKQKIFLYQLLNSGRIKKSRICLKKKLTNFCGAI